MAPFATDHFDKNLAQSLKGEDVDDGLDGAVEEGEEEGPVEPLGGLRGGEGGTGEDEAEWRDGDKKETGDENHLHCRFLQYSVGEDFLRFVICDVVMLDLL